MGVGSGVYVAVGGRVGVRVGIEVEDAVGAVVDVGGMDSVCAHPWRNIEKITKTVVMNKLVLFIIASFRLVIKE